MPPIILIYERRPRWVPELQRQFLETGVHVRGCANVKDLEERLALTPHAVCVFALDAADSDAIQALRRLNTRRPSPTIILAADPLLRDLEWPLRELGVLAFLEEPIPGDEMAAWCRRQFEINESH